MSQYIRRIDEEAEQEVVMQWARISHARWPELALLHHIPNGGSRSAREGAKLKRMGVLAGVSDLHLPVPHSGYHSLYIEMKAGDGRLQQSQKSFLHAAAAWGNCCIVCYTAEDAIEVIGRYLHNRNIENLSIIRGGKIIGTINE